MRLNPTGSPHLPGRRAPCASDDYLIMYLMRDVNPDKKLPQ
jgi:hypothetical protein